jgi:hypothetical protein
MATALATPFYLDIDHPSEIASSKNCGRASSAGSGRSMDGKSVSIERCGCSARATGVVLGFAWLAYVNQADRVLLAVVISFRGWVRVGTARRVHRAHDRSALRHRSSRCSPAWRGARSSSTHRPDGYRSHRLVRFIWCARRWRFQVLLRVSWARAAAERVDASVVNPVA